MDAEDGVSREKYYDMDQNEYYGIDRSQMAEELDETDGPSVSDGPYDGLYDGTDGWYRFDSSFHDHVDYNVGSLDPEIYECDGICMTTIAKSKLISIYVRPRVLKILFYCVICNKIKI